jgi:hypothetical protein
MFINENTANVFYKEATADPAYMYEAVLEANEAYHDICMKMVKCEHVAIVNENTELLAEAEGDFKAKVKKVLDTLLAKFMAFIDRVKAEWSKLWASVLSKLVSTEKVKFMKEVLDSSPTVNLTCHLEGLRVITNKTFPAIAALKPEELMSFSGVLNEFKVKYFLSVDGSSAAGGKGGKSTTISSGDVDMAVEFLEKRPQMIKTLESLRRTGKEMYKRDAIDNNTKADSLAIAKYSSLCSKLISFINSFTVDAVKICRACLKDIKKTNDKGDRKAARELYGEYKKDQKKAVKNGTASASVLDMFD